MERNHITILEESVLRINCSNTGSLNSFLRTESIVSRNFHTEALCDASHITAYIAESKDTKLLTQEFGARLAIIEIANGINQQTEYKFGYSIRVLAWSVLYDYSLLLGISTVYIIVSGACTNYDLELLSSVEYLGSNLVRTNNHSVGIGYSIKKLLLVSIFLKENKFVACSFNFCLNTIHGCCCKRFLGCHQYFHSKRFLIIIR